MTWPNVTINQLNQYQGTTKEVERVLLYIGIGTETGGLLSVNSQSDFDALLGADDSVLKSNVKAAFANAGQNTFGYVQVLNTEAKTEDWVAAVKAAQAVASVEGVVLLIDVKEKADIAAANTLRAELIARFGRWVWFILSVQGILETETWAEYETRLAALENGVAAFGVQLVPRLWGNEPGVLAGRLCNRSVTIADSPARVKTGPLLEIGSTEKPVDKDGLEISLANLQTLNANRYSVPMWYPDFDGMYWADGLTLDVEGGDYQVIEYLRTVDKAARRVRLQAITKIGDRSMNSTPGSIAANQVFFSRTLREMSRSTQINNVAFPGEVKPPRDGDVVITWMDSKTVSIYLTVRPYESPKAITVNILLDTSLETETRQ
ncbi:DUF2586 domain-containing protein [Serratia sp. CY66712]|uniref:DUF2586 domain-containing protein n=1 Tax=Serratia sp. CY66712 TaxID=3383659 RepID=UPI003F9F5D35